MSIVAKSVPTYTATIWIGLRKQYTGTTHKASLAKEWLQKYCDQIGFCVSVTHTKFIYKQGNENGLQIGLINYPRFPVMDSDIKAHAFKIATELMKILEQIRCTIVLTDETIMLENTELSNL